MGSLRKIDIEQKEFFLYEAP